MANVGYEEDIKPLFTPFAQCMAQITIATDQGVFQADLLDYETVKTLNENILVAIRGHDPQTPSAHPMPPGGPLPDASIQLFADWVDEGMPRTR